LDEDEHIDEEEKPRLQVQIENKNNQGQEVNEDDNIDEDEEDEEDDEVTKHTHYKNRASANILDLIGSTGPTMGVNIPTFPADLIKETRSSNTKGYQISYFVKAIYKKCRSHGISPPIIDCKMDR
jgi:hypothetical protein